MPWHTKGYGNGSSLIRVEADVYVIAAYLDFKLIQHISELHYSFGSARMELLPSKEILHEHYNILWAFCNEHWKRLLRRSELVTAFRCQPMFQLYPPVAMVDIGISLEPCAHTT